MGLKVAENDREEELIKIREATEKRIQMAKISIELDENALKYLNSQIKEKNI